jgi:hypothetical protein
MKYRRRYRRGLPSPLEVTFYLLAVVIFCVLNWVLLKADNTEPSTVDKSFETMIVEHMLQELTPVMKAQTEPLASNALNFGVSSEQSLEVESWMISIEAFTLSDTEKELVVEDWMLSLSSWQTDP